MIRSPQGFSCALVYTPNPAALIRQVYESDALYLKEMNPRLVAISGPQRGSTFLLRGEELSIGRDTSNWIAVADLSASRKHCIISRQQDQFHVTDLESRNGTYVNTIPVRTRALKHGDRIDLGESSFIFLLEEDLPPSHSLPQDDLEAHPTVRMRVQDALYLQPERLLISSPVSARIARGLDCILRLSNSIQTLREMESILGKILESLFQTIPAQRGSIILLEHEEIESAFTCDKNLQRNDNPVSQTVTRQVIKDDLAILSNDVVSNRAGIASAKSLTQLKVTSLIAVPMISADRKVGVLYLETCDSAVRFDEDHLQLASAIATLGATAIENHRYLDRLRDSHDQLTEEIRIEHSLIGESAEMNRVYELISKVAPTDSTVLIRGESGTGKELAARAIHLNSARAGRPFVVINCATLSESLLETELFGHEKGAFTGAIALKKGKLEVADGGTVFLDEAGEIPASVQSRLLRVLQEREFDRVGGIRPIRVDIRVIAATNTDLEAALKSGSFRKDLYYRLNVVQINMPTLRERSGDIPLLASYFAGKYARKCRRRVTGISMEARQLLIQYNWPGNVRELENAIERAVVLGTGSTILPEDLPENIQESGLVLDAPGFSSLIRETKRKLVSQALQQTEGNQSEAARILGMHPNNLSRLLRNLKL